MYIYSLFDSHENMNIWKILFPESVKCIFWNHVYMLVFGSGSDEGLFVAIEVKSSLCHFRETEHAFTKSSRIFKQCSEASFSICCRILDTCLQKMLSIKRSKSRAISVQSTTRALRRGALWLRAASLVGSIVRHSVKQWRIQARWAISCSATLSSVTLGDHAQDLLHPRSDELEIDRPRFVERLRSPETLELR